MKDYSKTKSKQRVTLNSLKEQQYSLNMQMLLAMEYHDVEVQSRINKELLEVQAEINRMGSSVKTGCALLIAD